MDNTTAKELAAELRAKADKLDALTEEEFNKIMSNDSSLTGCTFSTPCRFVDCFINSPA